jgi:hypothetical protein
MKNRNNSNVESFVSSFVLSRFQPWVKATVTTQLQQSVMRDYDQRHANWVQTNDMQG